MAHVQDSFSTQQESEMTFGFSIGITLYYNVNLLGKALEILRDQIPNFSRFFHLKAPRKNGKYHNHSEIIFCGCE